MKNFPVLRLLLAGVMLYFALPHIPAAVPELEQLFWAMWIGFFLLVFGANLANLLQMIQAPVMEQTMEEKNIRGKH
jgi:SNF family Na+-dependent transporter